MRQWSLVLLRSEICLPWRRSISGSNSGLSAHHAALRRQATLLLQLHRIVAEGEDVVGEGRVRRLAPRPHHPMCSIATMTPACWSNSSSSAEDAEAAEEGVEAQDVEAL